MPRGGKRDGAGRRPGKVAQARRDLADMAKTHAAAALKTLAEIAKDGESESARVSAATAILDRAYGRPPQAMQLTGEEGGPIKTEDVTDQKRLAALAHLIAKASRANGD